MIRIGVDFGGTKIEAAAVDADGAVRARRRAANPGAYAPALQTVARLVAEVEAEVGPCARLGVGAPGSISPRDGLIRNANSTWLNGRALGRDLGAVMGREVRLANDANCMALSEAVDGAGAGAGVVFGVILGTGCGGGVVVDGRILAGRNGIGGEWGHSPLPWPSAEEHPGRRCWCGRLGCLETWVSGPALEADHARATGERLTAAEVAAAAAAGAEAARASLDRHIDRLGRALASACDLLDPDVVVLAGGLCHIEALYQRLPAVVVRHVFSDVFDTPIVKARHGDASGVRGAAWLWPA